MKTKNVQEELFSFWTHSTHIQANVRYEMCYGVLRVELQSFSVFSMIIPKLKSYVNWGNGCR